jgi:hypothetical protein
MGKVGAKRIPERFDKAHPVWAAKEQLPQELRQEMSQTAKLDRFRKEMKAFLKANNLPTGLFTDPDDWAKFMHLYGKIIDECQLMLKGDGEQLQFIDRVVVHLKEAPKPLASQFGTQKIISICWTSHGTDGKSVDFDVIFGMDEPEADPIQTA